ncbi:MAG: hypothetical protein FDZ70_06490, partial [Actinobacteria bacterium]
MSRRIRSPSLAHAHSSVRFKRAVVTADTFVDAEGVSEALPGLRLSGGDVKRTGLTLATLAVGAIALAAGVVASVGPAQALTGYGYVTGWGTLGSANGQFNGPLGVEVDSAGNVWVADSGNNRLQKFTSLDASPAHSYVTKVATVTGATIPTLSGPRDVAFDTAGNLWIADTGHDAMLELNSSLAFVDEIDSGWTKGDPLLPSGLAYANTALFEADYGSGKVQKYTYTPLKYSNAKTSPLLTSPWGITFGPGGTYCYVSSGATNHNVVRFTYSGGKLGSARTIAGATAAGTADGRFNGPRGVVVYQGRLLVADYGNDRVQAFDATTGAFITKFGTSGSGPGQLDGPVGLAVDAAGRVYVADSLNNRIQVFFADWVSPVTTATGVPSGWSTATPVNVSLVATDPAPGASGILGTRYILNGSAAATYTATLTISAEGTSVLRYWSIDNAGNVESTKTATITIDSVAPTTTSDAPAAWQTSPVNVTLTATDAASGIYATRYRLASGGTTGAVTTYTAPVNVSAEGTNTLEYWSVDVAGNREVTRTATLRLDLSAPISTASVPATWQPSTPVTVTMSATDATSGVYALYYALDGGPVTTYTAPFQVSAEGATRIEHFAVDVAGNREATKTAYARIDLTPPTGTMVLNNGDLYTATTTVFLDSAISDISPLEMRIGSGPWIPYASTVTTVVPSGNGTKTVSVTYRDSAGWTLSLADDIVFDVAAPSGTMVVSGNASYTGTVAVTVDSTVTNATSMSVDPGSGVFGSWIATASSIATELPAGDGLKTVYVRFVNSGGLIVTLEDTITLDTSAPFGTMAVSGGAAYTSTRTVTVDSSVSDLAPIEMRVDPGTGVFGGWFPYSASVTTQVPAGDGVKTLRAEYRDPLLHTLATTDTIVLDTITPATSHDAPSGWQALPVWVTLTPSDAGSGPAYTLYRLNGAAAVTYTVPVLVATEGTNTLQFWSYDNAGNRESTRTATVTVDFSAPVTTDNAPAAWQTASPVTVLLSATDAYSGVLGIRYRVNGGAVATYAAGVTVSAQGTNTVEYRAVDTAGNWEATKTATVRIDSQPPTTTSGVAVAPSWVTTDVISLVASDAASGVFETYYEVLDPVNGPTGEMLYTEPTPLGMGDGTWDLWIRSVDVAGNWETSHTITLKIDTVDPVTTDNAPAGWVSAASVTVTLTPSDSGSGLAGTHYWVNGGAETSGTTLAVSAQGTTTVQYRSFDQAGRYEATKTATVRLDSVAPTATMMLNAGDSFTGTTTVSVDSSVTDISAVEMKVGSGPWMPYASSVTTVVPSGDGVKTVTVQYRDEALNVRSVTDTITLSSTAPAGTMVVSGGAAYTATIAVTVDATVTNAVSMTVDPGTGSYGGWIAYTAQVTTSLPSGDGVKTVRVQYLSGTLATATISD